MNKILLVGRLVRDAELSFLPGTGTPKVAFTIAVDRAYQKDKNNKKTDFIPCEMIGKHVEKLSSFLTKGKLVGVEGELNIDRLESDGPMKSFTKVKVDRLEFLGGKSDSNNFNPKPNFEAIDEELPF